MDANNATTPTSSLTNELPQVTSRPRLSPYLRQQIAEIFFRQSMMKDYMTCPQMALYRWILNVEGSIPFLSAVLGTAGHEVIYTMHSTHNYEMDYTTILTLLETAFYKALKKEPIHPIIPEGCESLDDAFAIKAPDYVKLIHGYQYHPRNRSFHCTFHEQSFVLEIPLPNGKPYLFTGQIDQGGYYDDGLLAVRDTKFRDNHFRPYKPELDQDLQATIYCAAVRFGNPACENCKPRYVSNPLAVSTGKTLEYNGPCTACAKKIGTPEWPRKFPQLFEFIWMNDFDTHKKDQFDEWVIDNTKPKIANPKGKGPPVYPRKPNPEYDRGYKKGQFKGPGFLQTVRPPSSINVLFGDILRICDQIRDGVFYRRPGQVCSAFCRYFKQCQKGIETEIQEADLASVSAYGTDDPW